jgi:hypothetical protein
MEKEPKDKVKITAVTDALKNVCIAVVGNFFPFWWGFIILSFLNSWKGFGDFGKITDILIIAAAFFTSTHYLIYKNKISWIVWCLLLMGSLINATLFALYIIKDKIIVDLPFANNLNMGISWVILALAIFLFGYAQYVDAKRSFGGDAESARNEDYNNLKNKFSTLISRK